MTRRWNPTNVAAVACPICHVAGPIPALLTDDGHILHRCPICHVCFYANRLMPDYELEEETDFYQQVYLEQNASIHHVTRFLFTVDQTNIESVLDVGCGYGFAVDMAANVLGWRAVGIDPSHYAREGARLLQADIRKDYLTSATELGEPFGLVVASEVIEHIPDPDGFIQVLRRWLQPGGTLILTTPDADAIRPEASEADLVSILAVGTHLFLFSATALELVLRRGGFDHVEVQSCHNNLVALASNQPIRHSMDGEQRHIEAYRIYLSRLVEAVGPGSALWNGAVGRLFALQSGSLPLEQLHAIFARIAAAWLPRFGIDLLRMRLPELLPEQAYVGAGKPFMWQLGPRQPINLATVLYHRAVLENRRSGRLPEDVLRWARPAYTHAVETVRVLMTGTIIDLDLRQTAWRARILIFDLLSELAPELEGELLLGVGTPAPGELHQRIDPPPEILAARAAPYFTRMVQAGLSDHASRVEAWVANVDVLTVAMQHDPLALFYALFALGVHRARDSRHAAEARVIFGRLVREAETRMHLNWEAPIFRQAALDHMSKVQLGFDCSGNACPRDTRSKKPLPTPFGFKALHDIMATSGPRQAMMLSREEFDETYYLFAHSDVREVVAAGSIPSGYDHYKEYGFKERRAVVRRSPTLPAV